MKKYSVLFSLGLGMLYITLSSDIDGPAHHGHGDITGAATGTTGHCQTSSCHGANNPLNVVQLQILDSSTLLPVTTYHALQTYLVTLSGDATGVSTNLSGYGFQVSAALGNHTLAGSYTIPAASSHLMHTFACGATTVVEQTTTLSQTTTGTNKYATQFYWTAPSAGSDSVSFYALLNAVNGDGGKHGDYPNVAKVTVYEDTAVIAGVAPVSNTENELTLYPNPATTQITVTAKNRITSLIIASMTGQVVYSRSFDTHQAQVYVAGLPAGAYLVTINGGMTRRFIKK